MAVREWSIGNKQNSRCRQPHIGIVVVPGHLNVYRLNRSMAVGKREWIRMNELRTPD